MELETPDNIAYQKPSESGGKNQESAQTPRGTRNDDTEIITVPSSPSEERWESEDGFEDNTEDMNDNEVGSPYVSLSWNGYTITDLNALVKFATKHYDRDTNQAEVMLKQALNGYTALLSSTHEETTRDAQHLASFYFERGRIPEAHKVIADSCRAHIEEHGIAHRRTQQHIMNVIELLNGCNRQNDALAVLARVKELMAKNSTSDKINRRRRRKDKGDIYSPRRTTTCAPQLSDVIRSMSNAAEPAGLDHGIGVARIYVRANDEAVEELLLAIIRQCDQNTDKLAIQRLQAWTELLNLYNRLNKASINFPRFEGAHEAFNRIQTEFPWHVRTRERFRPQRVIEVMLELVAAFLKAGYSVDAQRMFVQIGERTQDVFGWNDERSIWTLISISLVYQNYNTWSSAREWFEQALSAAMHKYDEDDGIRMSLEEAMQVRHFSYLNDEGRPFKTIFGVGGLTIRPTRLHLD